MLNNLWTKEKQNKFFFQVKNIAGRVLETTRSENPYNAIQLFIKQNVPLLNYDYLETRPWNKK